MSPRKQFSQDIHAQKGLTCASCHGGDPTSDDPDKAMSRKAGWKGKIDRKQIPQLCGSCHSDPDYMRQFNPSLRTDQLSQYHTSVHGKRLAAGDAKVAVCTDCHGVHDLRAPSDSRSTVNPVNVANTCARCHADAAYMSRVQDPNQPVCGIRQERPSPRAGCERRPECSDLHHVPRQPRCHSSGICVGSQCLLDLPRLSGPII